MVFANTSSKSVACLLILFILSLKKEQNKQFKLRKHLMCQVLSLYKHSYKPLINFVLKSGLLESVP